MGRPVVEMTKKVSIWDEEFGVTIFFCICVVSSCLREYQRPKVSQPHFGAKCEDETHTPKVGDLESSGTPECLEFNSKGRNTLDWGVLGVIGKVLKCRCPKWPCISHLDIYSPSYGQKKGRESNWQFDSRPLKVRNRPLPDVYRWSAIRRWKALEEGYNFGLDLTPIGDRNQEL
ncbi:unnamed protein product [Sphagnum compactum]